MLNNLQTRITELENELRGLNSQSTSLENKIVALRVAQQFIENTNTTDSLVDGLDSLVKDGVLKVLQLNPDYPIINNLREILNQVENATQPKE